MTERIASTAEPVVLPARCCFVTARRLADSKDVEMAASLNAFDNPMWRLLTLACLAGSFRGTVLGVLMVAALLQSRIRRDEGPGRKAPSTGRILSTTGLSPMRLGRAWRIDRAW